MMWRLVPAIAVLICAGGTEVNPPASQPTTTQRAPNDIEARLHAVEIDVAAIIHMITTGEVQTPPVNSAAPPPAPDRTGRPADQWELDSLRRRVETLERLVGGSNRDLVTQAPTGLKTDTAALERRIDQLERQVRDQEREIQQLKRRLDRPARP